MHIASVTCILSSNIEPARWQVRERERESVSECNFLVSIHQSEREKKSDRIGSVAISNFLCVCVSSPQTMRRDQVSPRHTTKVYVEEKSSIRYISRAATTQRREIKIAPYTHARTKSGAGWLAAAAAKQFGYRWTGGSSGGGIMRSLYNDFSFGYCCCCYTFHCNEFFAVPALVEMEDWLAGPPLHAAGMNMNILSMRCFRPNRWLKRGHHRLLTD